MPQFFVSVTCPPISTGDFIVLSTQDTTFDSTVTLECITGYIFSSGQTSQNVTCTLTGEWDNDPDSFTCVGESKTMCICTCINTGIVLSRFVSLQTYKQRISNVQLDTFYVMVLYIGIKSFRRLGVRFAIVCATI